MCKVHRTTDVLREEIAYVAREATHKNNTPKWQHANFGLADSLTRILDIKIRVEQGLERTCTDEYVANALRIQESWENSASE